MLLEQTIQGKKRMPAKGRYSHVDYLYLYCLLQIECLKKIKQIIQPEDLNTFKELMLKHYSSATHGDFRRNRKVLYRVIQVCHKDVCHEQAQVKAQ